MNKYLAILIAVFASAEAQAQTVKSVPRLVVNIMIDELRSEILDKYRSIYSTEGFNKLQKEGISYANAEYSFPQLNHAACIASFVTGASPKYHNIVGSEWFDRQNLRIQNCVTNTKGLVTPAQLGVSTIADELKISTLGKGLVYSIGKNKEDAVLAGGHAADAAYWYTENIGWQSSSYYSENSLKWISSYNKVVSNNTASVSNEDISNLALECIKNNALGKDNNTDLLYICLSAYDNHRSTNINQEAENYLSLDRTIAHLISKIETLIDKEHLLFVVTGSANQNDNFNAYSAYRIPTGILYINRTAHLLNIYLNAIYGQGQFVEGYHKNEIFLNRKLINERHISLQDIYTRCQDFLIQTSGVAQVFFTLGSQSLNYAMSNIINGISTLHSGDIIIQAIPGWQVCNEDTGEIFTVRMGMQSFPVFFYGAGIESKQIQTRVNIDCIAPTIAKNINIRAPNACTALPLF